MLDIIAHGGTTMSLQNNKGSRTHEAVSTNCRHGTPHSIRRYNMYLYTLMRRIPRSHRPGPSFVAIDLTSCTRYSPEHARCLRRHRLTPLGNFPGFVGQLGTALALLWHMSGKIVLCCETDLLLPISNGPSNRLSISLSRLLICDRGRELRYVHI